MIYKRLKISFEETQLYHFLAAWLFILVLSQIVHFRIVSSLTIEGFSSYFILGASLSQMKTRKLAIKYIPTSIVAFFLSVKVFSNRLPEGQNRDLFPIFFLLIVVILICSSFYWDLSRFHLVNVSYLSTLSLMTYPIYMLHETIGLSVISMLTKHWLTVKSAYLVIFLVILFLSWLSVRYFEPFVRQKYRQRFA
jgi:hypothetical protein